MRDAPLFFPQTIYANRKGPAPRVLLAPQRYIQGQGILANTGKYLQLLGAKRVGILASSRGLKADAKTVINSIEAKGLEVHTSAFDGECSLAEIDKQVEAFSDKFVDCLIAVGGGKCVDAGKCIAYRLGIDVVIVPTLASNDAPTSAVSVLYTPDGVSSGAEFFPQNPAIVIVDIQLPDISGVDLHRILMEKNITIPIIFISGEASIQESIEPDYNTIKQNHLQYYCKLSIINFIKYFTFLNIKYFKNTYF